MFINLMTYLCISMITEFDRDIGWYRGESNGNVGEMIEGHRKKEVQRKACDSFTRTLSQLRVKTTEAQVGIQWTHRGTPCSALPSAQVLSSSCTSPSASSPWALQRLSHPLFFVELIWQVRL